MSGWNRRTYRDVDGQRIPGTWRHIFIYNAGTYFLADLKIYADGMIDCWGLVDLAGFREKLRSGRVATSLPKKGEASAHLLAAWTFGNVMYSISAEDLYGEVVDEIERLAGRPTTSEQCLEALERYCETRSEEDRKGLATAYLQIPETHRRFVLGDQDRKDWPVRILATKAGDRMIGSDAGAEPRIVTAEDRDSAFAYFEQRRQADADYLARPRDDGPGLGDPGSVLVELRIPSKEWPANPGLLALRNEYPSAMVIPSGTYPTVTHAYWATSVVQSTDRERIVDERNAYALRRIALDMQRWPDWPQQRLAVMQQLLTAKFEQHSDLVELLLATGDRRIIYEACGDFWGSGRNGRNWMGRLLEIVRSSLEAG